MGQSINLIPKEVKTEQVKVRVVKASTVFTILILLGMGAAATFVRYTNAQVKKQITSADSQVTKLRKDIEALADIEIVARNLDKKYAAIEKILSGRVYYSVLMQELKSRIPSPVEITDFVLAKTDSASITGSGQTYLSISEFFTNLGNPANTGDSELAHLFTAVTLNSVNLESRDNSAKYLINTGFDRKLLKK